MKLGLRMILCHRARMRVDGKTGMLGAVAVCAMLSACASQDSAARFLVQPDKYMLYNCKELFETARSNEARQHELEALIAKAGSDSGGQFVGNMAYRPEYVQLKGKMNELKKTAGEKNCNIEAPAAGQPAVGPVRPLR